MASPAAAVTTALKEANAAIKAGDFPRAIDAAEGALLAYPASVDLLLVCAFSCTQSKRYADAEAYLRRVLRADPANVQAKQGLLDVHRKTESWGGQVEALQSLRADAAGGSAPHDARRAARLADLDARLAVAAYGDALASVSVPPSALTPAAVADSGGTGPTPALLSLSLSSAGGAGASALEAVAREVACTGGEGGVGVDPLRARALHLKALLTVVSIREGVCVLGVPSANHFSSASQAGAGAGVDPGPGPTGTGVPPLLGRLVQHGAGVSSAYARALSALLLPDAPLLDSPKLDDVLREACVSRAAGPSPSLSAAHFTECYTLIKRALSAAGDACKLEVVGASAPASAPAALSHLAHAVVGWATGLGGGWVDHAGDATLLESSVAAVGVGPRGQPLLSLLALTCELCLAYAWSCLPAPWAPAFITILDSAVAGAGGSGLRSPVATLADTMLHAAALSAPGVGMPGAAAASLQAARHSALQTALTAAVGAVELLPPAVRTSLPWAAHCLAGLHVACARTAATPSARAASYQAAATCLKAHVSCIGGAGLLGEGGVGLEGAPPPPTGNLSMRKLEAWIGRGGVAPPGDALSSPPLMASAPSLPCPSPCGPSADLSLYSLGSWLPTSVPKPFALPLAEVLPLAVGKAAGGKGATPGTPASILPPSLESDATILQEAVTGAAQRGAAAGACSTGLRGPQVCAPRLYAPFPSPTLTRTLALLSICLCGIPRHVGGGSREGVSLARAVHAWIDRRRGGGADVEGEGHMALLAASCLSTAALTLLAELPAGLTSDRPFLSLLRGGGGARGPGVGLEALSPHTQPVLRITTLLDSAGECLQSACTLCPVLAQSIPHVSCCVSLARARGALSLLSPHLVSEGGTAAALEEAKALRMSHGTADVLPLCLYPYQCASMLAPSAPTLPSRLVGALGACHGVDEVGVSALALLTAQTAWRGQHPAVAPIQSLLLLALSLDSANAGAWALLGVLLACPAGEGLPPLGGKAVAGDGAPRNPTRASACLLKALELAPADPVAGPAVIDALAGGEEEGAHAGALPPGVLLVDASRARVLATAATATDNTAWWAHWRVAALAFREGSAALAAASDARGLSSSLTLRARHAAMRGCSSRSGGGGEEEDRAIAQEHQAAEDQARSYNESARIHKEAATASFVTCAAAYDRALSLLPPPPPTLRDVIGTGLALSDEWRQAWSPRTVDAYVSCWSGLSACYAGQGRPAACVSAAATAVEAAVVLQGTAQPPPAQLDAHAALRLRPSSVYSLAASLLGGAWESMDAVARPAAGAELLSRLRGAPPHLLAQLAGAHRALGSYEPCLVLLQLASEGGCGDALSVVHSMGVAHRGLSRRLVGDSVLGEGYAHGRAGEAAARVGMAVAGGPTSTSTPSDAALLPLCKLVSDCASLAYDVIPWGVHPVSAACGAGRADVVPGMLEGGLPAVTMEERAAWAGRLTEVLSSSMSGQGSSAMRSFTTWLSGASRTGEGDAEGALLHAIPSLSHPSLHVQVGARSAALAATPDVWACVVGSWRRAFLAALRSVEVLLEGLSTPAPPTATTSSSRGSTPYTAHALSSALCDLGRVLWLGHTSILTSCGATGWTALFGSGGGGGRDAATPALDSPMAAALAHADHLRSLSALVHSLACCADPSSPRAWNGLGVTEASPPLAQHAFVRCVSVGGGGIPLVNLGALYVAHGALDAARGVLLQAQTKDPSNESMWLTLGAMGDGRALLRAMEGAGGGGRGGATSALEQDAGATPHDAYILATQLTLHPSATLPAALHGLGLLPWLSAAPIAGGGGVEDAGGGGGSDTAADPFIPPLAWGLARLAVEADPCNPLSWAVHAVSTADEAGQLTHAALWAAEEGGVVVEEASGGTTGGELDPPTTGSASLPGQAVFIARCVRPLQLARLTAVAAALCSDAPPPLAPAACRAAARGWEVTTLACTAALERGVYLARTLRRHGVEGGEEGERGHPPPMLTQALGLLRDGASVAAELLTHAAEGLGTRATAEATLTALHVVLERVRALLKGVSPWGADTVVELAGVSGRASAALLSTAIASIPGAAGREGTTETTVLLPQVYAQVGRAELVRAGERALDLCGDTDGHDAAFEFAVLGNLLVSLALPPPLVSALLTATQAGVLTDAALARGLDGARHAAGKACAGLRAAQTGARYEARMAVGGVQRPVRLPTPTGERLDTAAPPTLSRPPPQGWRTAAVEVSVSALAEGVAAGVALMRALGGVGGGFSPAGLRTATARAALAVEGLR